ncbi:MAG TPA: AraC family transcriptional regulator [Gemmatimonas sp.]|nr:AraC family transcriptional regulator [Gemmatimonas sp.]
MSALYARHRFPAHAHETFAIGVVVRGTSATRYRGAIDVHRPGGLIVIEPGEIHTGEPRDGDGWGYRMIYPSAAQLAALSMTPIELVSAPGLSAGSFIADPLLAERFLAAHELLQRSQDDASAPEDTVRGSVLMTDVLCDLTTVLTAERQSTPQALDERPVAVRVVCDFLEANYASRVSLSQLTALVSLSPFQLIRVFRRNVGVTPYAFLALIRVQRARELLRTGVPATHVAFATGFCDQSHFTRVFRHIAGMTPGQYAAAHRTSHRISGAPVAERRVGLSASRRAIA